MKKVKILAVSLATITLLSGCTVEVIQEENKDETTTTTKTASEFNPQEFLGTWSSERPIIDVTQESNNTYKFLVSWGSSAEEHTEWDYTCNFDEEKEVMDCTGTKTTYVFTDADNSKSTVDGENQKAEFSLKDGVMTWDEQEDNSAVDLKFTKDE